jgi:acyl phosphate:glycerol-3-phosphate acyltransferase
MLLAGLFVAAYVLGAVPFGVLITRALGVDVTKIGSGNIGATNVARAVGKKWAILVFLLDVMKGFAPVFATRYVDPREWVWYLVGLAAVAGHCASPFLKFKGGKGVATSLGMAFGASPLVATGGLLVFAVLFAITRYVSLSSIVGVGLAVVFAAVLKDWVYVGIGSALFAFVLYTHRANIGRLMNGTENRFEFKKKDQAKAPKPATPPLDEEDEELVDKVAVEGGNE